MTTKNPNKPEYNEDDDSTCSQVTKGRKTNKNNILEQKGYVTGGW